jgi:putative transposase
MIDRGHALSVTKQAEAAGIARSTVYYLPRPVSAADLELMRQIDRLHLEFPFAGARMLRGLLAARGKRTGRRHVKTLMRRMGIEALYRRPRTTKPEPGHKVYPYLLRGLEIVRPNQVWAMDLSGGRARLVFQAGAVLARLDHNGGGFLYRSARRGASCLVPACGGQDRA